MVDMITTLFQPVWTHESIGYPKMDLIHWDAVW